jgi:hypothetical protein
MKAQKAHESTSTRYVHSLWGFTFATLSIFSRALQNYQNISICYLDSRYIPKTSYPWPILRMGKPGLSSKFWVFLGVCLGEN